MPGPEEITSRLERAGIDYCIVGGLASIAYGRPRLTLDADLVVAISPGQVASLIEAFPAEDFYLPPAEVLRAESQGGSEKHLEDIRGMLSATRVDQKIITKWVDQLGLAESWSAATLGC